MWIEPQNARCIQVSDSSPSALQIVLIWWRDTGFTSMYAFRYQIHSFLILQLQKTSIDEQTPPWCDKSWLLFQVGVFVERCRKGKGIVYFKVFHGFLKVDVNSIYWKKCSEVLYLKHLALNRIALCLPQNGELHFLNSSDIFTAFEHICFSNIRLNFSSSKG